MQTAVHNIPDETNSYKHFLARPSQSSAAAHAPEHATLILAQRILNYAMQFRRTLPNQMQCSTSCPHCHAPHLNKIIKSIESSQPVRFALPAFPGKSPNPAKVLSPAPDRGEELALGFLQQLCDGISDIYPIGAKILVCSDGRVFSDVVGMQEEDVTLYQNELADMILRIGATDLELFNLETIWPNRKFTSMRENLMANYGISSAELKQLIQSSSAQANSQGPSELKNMHLGITRFLSEDSAFPGQTKTRSAIQKESKEKAIEVIRRSNAWSALIEHCFPELVRLSIHPQMCGAKKLGIQLIGNDAWMTPWHGVVVQQDDSFKLMKRREAEALGGQIVFSKNGKPSHFVLHSNSSSNFETDVLRKVQ